MSHTGQDVMPGRWRLLAGLFLAIFGVAFEMIGMATAMPTIMDDLDARALYAWAFSSLVIGQLLATIIAGRVADRVGPLPPMLTGFLLFIAGLVLGSLAPNATILLLARAVQGLGAGGLSLSMFVTIALVFHGRERATVLGMLSFVWLLPAFLGPPLAAWLTTYTWRLVFSSMIPLLLLAGLLTLPSMRRVQARFVPDDDPDVVAWWAVAVVSVAPAGIQSAGQGWGWLSVAAGVLGVVGLVVALPRVLPPAVRHLGRGLGAVVASRALAAGSFFAAEAFVLLVLQDVRGLTPFQAGIALTIGSVGWTTGAWVQARPWLRIRRDEIITLGALLINLGLVGLVAFVAGELGLVVGVMAWIAAGLGMGLMMPSAAVATMDLSRPQEQGRHNAALQLAEGLGNALLTGVAGATYAATIVAWQSRSYLALFLVLWSAVTLAVFVSRRIGPIENSSAARGA